MSSINDIYPSNSRFYRAIDLDPKLSEEWTVSGCTLEQFPSGESKLALWFTGHDKGIVLNKTNAMACVGNWDDDWENWKDLPVLVESIPRQTPSGEATRGFILTPVKGGGKKKPAPGASESFEDDDLPF